MQTVWKGRGRSPRLMQPVFRMLYYIAILDTIFYERNVNKVFLLQLKEYLQKESPKSSCKLFSMINQLTYFILQILKDEISKLQRGIKSRWVNFVNYVFSEYFNSCHLFEIFVLKIMYFASPFLQYEVSWKLGLYLLLCYRIVHDDCIYENIFS